MTIKSRPFGGLYLSGEDAEAFQRQVKYGRPNKRAKAALARGLKLVAEFAANGRARVTARD